MVTPRPAPKRKPVPDRVKVQALLRMLGLAGKTIEWSHEPALALRAINDDGTDYKPAQLDPRYIVARERAKHARLTNEDNGSGRSDKGAIAYVRHLGRDSLEHREKMAAKLTGAAPVPELRKRTIQSRAFGTQHRPLRGRRKKA